MPTNVTYKGSSIASFADTTKTLKTAGKYMEDDVTIIDTIPSIVLTEEHLQPGGGYSIDLTTLGTTPPSIVDTLDINGGTIRTITTDIEVNLQSKNATPSSVQQTITCDSSYDGLSEVLVSAIPSEYIIPAGILSITENGSAIDVAQYSAVNVNVFGGDVYQDEAGFIIFAEEGEESLDMNVEVTVSSDGNVAYSLDAGKLYHFTGNLTNLTLTLNETSRLKHYHFDFFSGSTAPSVSLPSNIILPQDFAILSNKRYELDILNNYGTVGVWAN